MTLHLFFSYLQEEMNLKTEAEKPTEVQAEPEKQPEVQVEPKTEKSEEKK